ncbi:MAG: FAD binding domain-containing protein [Alphaproteobacteria bacterium]
MKPVAFEYCRPDTLDEAMELLAEFGGDASIVSGGLSLGAMLNMRLVRPVALIDINHLGELADIKIGDATASTGALVRQAAAQKFPGLMSGVPLLSRALPWVGHYQTRSRGTLGGSVAHADPSAEIPLTLVTLGGAVKLQSPGGTRDVPAREFFHGLLTTDRRADELITALTWPLRRDKTGYAFDEIAQRHGDFAITAVAAAATVGDDGNIADLSFGLGGVEDRPIVVDTDGYVGKPATAETAQDIAHAAAEAVDPMIDLQANADYRRQLVRVLGARVLSSAFNDAASAREAA